jgi:hypothetical protein
LEFDDLETVSVDLDSDSRSLFDDASIFKACNCHLEPPISLLSDMPKGKSTKGKPASKAKGGARGTRSKKAPQDIDEEASEEQPQCDEVDMLGDSDTGGNTAAVTETTEAVTASFYLIVMR